MVREWWAFKECSLKILCHSVLPNLDHHGSQSPTHFDCPIQFFVSEKNIKPDDGKHLKFVLFAISILAIFKGVHQPFVLGGGSQGLRGSCLWYKHHFKTGGCNHHVEPLLWRCLKTNSLKNMTLNKYTLWNGSCQVPQNPKK